MYHRVVLLPEGLQPSGHRYSADVLRAMAPQFEHVPVVFRPPGEPGSADGLVGVCDNVRVVERNGKVVLEADITLIEGRPHTGRVRALFDAKDEQIRLTPGTGLGINCVAEVDSDGRVTKIIEARSIDIIGQVDIEGGA